METSDSVKLAAEIVAAFVSYNPLPRSDLPALIQAVHSTVESLAKGSEFAQPQAETKPSAVPIRKSITPDYLVCWRTAKDSNPCDDI